MKTKPFEIPNILDSYRRSVTSGETAIEQAAIELNAAGWMCFDVEDVKRLLKID